MKTLYRSQTDRKIAGVLGGLGELFNIDSNLLRLATVLLFFISGFFPVLITYFVAWLILPDGNPENVEVKTQEPEKPKTSRKTSSRSGKDRKTK